MIYLTIAKSFPEDALTPAASLACPAALAWARDQVNRERLVATVTSLWLLLTGVH